MAFIKYISDGVNIHCLHPGDTVSTFLARDTAAPYVDNRPLLVPGKPGGREYQCVCVQSDAEIGLYSDEAVITCAP